MKSLCNQYAKFYRDDGNVGVGVGGGGGGDGVDSGGGGGSGGGDGGGGDDDDDDDGADDDDDRSTKRDNERRSSHFCTNDVSQLFKPSHSHGLCYTGTTLETRTPQHSQ